ncbi:MAG: hypothetical protein IKE18_04935 [Oscillospiraceae bacterium]|nr:hypothetical protein [Oscillospiraceae bacterium]
MEVKTVVCPNCNKTVDLQSGEFAFCPYCGSKLTIPVDNEPKHQEPVQSYEEYIEEQTQRKSKMIKLTLLCAVIAVIFVIIVANGKAILELPKPIGNILILLSTPGIFFAFGMTFRYFSGVIIAKKNIEEAKKKRAEESK